MNCYLKDQNEDKCSCAALLRVTGLKWTACRLLQTTPSTPTTPSFGGIYYQVTQLYHHMTQLANQNFTADWGVPPSQEVCHQVNPHITIHCTICYEVHQMIYTRELCFANSSLPEIMIRYIESYNILLHRMNLASALIQQKIRILNILRPLHTYQLINTHLYGRELGFDSRRKAKLSPLAPQRPDCFWADPASYPGGTINSLVRSEAAGT